MRKNRMISRSFAAAQASLDAARVVAARTPMILASAGGAPGHAVEMRRMVQEKTAAGAEGALAAGVALGAFWLDMVTGRVRNAADVTHAMGDIAEAAAAPARKKVRANVRRLTAQARRGKP